MEIKFYDQVEDHLLEFAVIVSRSNGKWVFCKHKERTTYECPGGHREEQETILQAAHRELQEETGAISYALKPICPYSVTDSITELPSYGMLFYADITSFEPELHSEIEKIILLKDLPNECQWTYPKIQPLLLKRVSKMMTLTL